MEHLAEPESELRAGRCRGLQPHDAGKVLAHVEHEHAGTLFAHAPGGQLLRHADRLGRVGIDHRGRDEPDIHRAFHTGLEEGRGATGIADRRDAGVPVFVGREVRRVPAGLFEPSVVRLAHEEIGLTDRSLVGHLP